MFHEYLTILPRIEVSNSNDQFSLHKTVKNLIWIIILFSVRHKILFKRTHEKTTTTTSNSAHMADIEISFYRQPESKKKHL